MKKTTSCFVAALLSSAAFANTATYYVAMDGDDSAAGTADAPLLSVLTAVTRANESIDGGDDSATIHVLWAIRTIQHKSKSSTTPLRIVQSISSMPRPR